ncbi:MAG: hypothetical protein MZV70_01270 [Desulfobacterales bacterium]|nr:hypothetical protein [Desulfobacterales bacterium]
MAKKELLWTRKSFTLPLGRDSASYLWKIFEDGKATGLSVECEFTFGGYEIDDEGKLKDGERDAPAVLRRARFHGRRPGLFKLVNLADKVSFNYRRMSVLCFDFVNGTNGETAKITAEIEILTAKKQRDFRTVSFMAGSEPQVDLEFDIPEAKGGTYKYRVTRVFADGRSEKGRMEGGRGDVPRPVHLRHRRQGRTGIKIPAREDAMRARRALICGSCIAAGGGRRSRRPRWPWTRSSRPAASCSTATTPTRTSTTTCPTRRAWRRNGTGRPNSPSSSTAKTDGATKGGIVHFLVTWGMTEGELSSAESALRLKDPEAKIAGPVPFKEGTFKVVSATAGEGGLFSRRIVGEGKAPIMPGQKAAVSIALTEEGASLLWESFKNPTSDVSVMFALKFAGDHPGLPGQAQGQLGQGLHPARHQAPRRGHDQGRQAPGRRPGHPGGACGRRARSSSMSSARTRTCRRCSTPSTAISCTLMCEKVPDGPRRGDKPTGQETTRSGARGRLGSPSRPGRWACWRTSSARRTSASAAARSATRSRSSRSRRTASPCDEQSRQKADDAGAEGRPRCLATKGIHQESDEFYKKAFEACPDPEYLYEIGKIDGYELF